MVFEITKNNLPSKIFASLRLCVSLRLLPSTSNSFPSKFLFTPGNGKLFNHSVVDIHLVAYPGFHPGLLILNPSGVLQVIGRHFVDAQRMDIAPLQGLEQSFKPGFSWYSKSRKITSPQNLHVFATLRFSPTPPLDFKLIPFQIPVHAGQWEIVQPLRG